jgi:hypothetical protein
MTETLYELIKSGKVTKVHNVFNGDSVRIELKEAWENYPILVHFLGRKSQAFTVDGRLLLSDKAPSLTPYIEHEQLPTDSTEREQPHIGTFERMESLRKQVIDLTELLCAKNDLIDTQREYIELLKSR